MWSVPVIGVDSCNVCTRCVCERVVDCCDMTKIPLMSDEANPPVLIGTCNGGTVIGGCIIHNDDLKIISTLLTEYAVHTFAQETAVVAVENSETYKRHLNT